MEINKVNKLIELYRDRPIEEDNIIIIRALEFYRDNQSFPKKVSNVRDM